MQHPVSRWLGAIALMVAAAHASAGEGPVAPPDGPASAWEGLRARLALGTAGPSRSESGLDSELPKINSFSLMGDYYVSRPWLGTSGGWRATSGLLIGARSSVWSSPALMDRRMVSVGADAGTDNSTLPYLGVGYTGWSSKGGWGLSADLGVLAMNPRASTKLGKAATVTQSLDDTVRDLRFSPIVQLGLSYSF